jgi:hypothetical protein
LRSRVMATPSGPKCRSLRAKRRLQPPSDERKEARALHYRDTLPKMLPRISRPIFVVVLSSILTMSAHAQSLKVTGQAGHLGEWEVTAEVVQTLAPGKKEYSGPLTLKHVGLCTQDGPEVKTGEIHIHLSGSASRVTAMLSYDGAVCSYSGKKEDAYTGLMSCPNRRDVPLLLWLK